MSSDERTVPPATPGGHLEVRSTVTGQLHGLLELLLAVAPALPTLQMN